MSRGRDSNVAAKIYVGDLPRDASEKEIERAFSYYGTLRNVWVARNPSGFAFVEFEDPRDADDAVHDLDGKTICGSRVRVEHSTGKVRQKPWNRNDRGPRGGGGGGGGSGGGNRRFSREDKCYECGESGHYAYDCHRYRSGRGSGRRRSRSRSRSAERSRRSYSRSRSRSRGRSASRD